MNKKYVDPNKRHYFDKLGLEELISLFRSFPKNHPLTFWEKGKSEDIVEELTFVKFDPEIKRIYLDYKTSFLNKLKGCPLEGKNVAFRFNIERYQYFSISQLTFDKEEGHYFVDLIEDVYLAQQRKNYRLNADTGVDLELVIGHHVLKCLDISAGGTSILVPEHLDHNFKEGQEHKGCPLTFNDQTYIIDKLKLVKKFASKERDRSGAVCYGIQFTEVDPATEETLTLKINSEARAKEIRKQMQEIRDRKKADKPGSKE